MLIRLFHTIGEYILFLGKVITKPEKWWIFYRETVKEIEKLGLNSIGIIAIISAFMGAVITIQTAYNTENPLLPNYLIGVAARDSILLEFSSTIVALILAGKVGSNIASEIGTMRVTEQIDALEIMGVNSASYLVLPKVVAAMVFNSTVPRGNFVRFYSLLHNLCCNKNGGFCLYNYFNFLVLRLYG